MFIFPQQKKNRFCDPTDWTFFRRHAQIRHLTTHRLRAQSLYGPPMSVYGPVGFIIIIVYLFIFNININTDVLKSLERVRKPYRIYHEAETCHEQMTGPKTGSIKAIYDIMHDGGVPPHGPNRRRCPGTYRGPCLVFSSRSRLSSTAPVRTSKYPTAVFVRSMSTPDATTYPSLLSLSGSERRMYRFYCNVGFL